VRTILSFGINALAEEKEITWHFRINPQNEAAKKGLERLEKQMKVCAVSEPYIDIYHSD